MSHKPTPDPAYEPERYELDESARYHFDFDRRTFLRTAGTGIVVWLAVDDVIGAQESGGGRRRGLDEGAPTEIAAWLHIGANGRITVYTGKVEVGQNTRTSLSQAVADELHVSTDTIELVMGDTDRVPFDIGTFGSLSTPRMAPQLRKAAAAAREILLALAAERWQVAPDALVVADGSVLDSASDRALTFAELTNGKTLAQRIPEHATVTSPERWTEAGRSVPKVNGRDFVTGKHRFVSDLKLDGMWYGKVLRPDSIGAVLVSADVSRAEAMDGVVLVRDGDFIGVAAPSAAQAERAIESIGAEWKAKPLPSASTIFEHLKAHTTEGEGFDRARRMVEGSVTEGLAEADETLESTYTVAYIAHAPLEPRAAVAKWENARLTAWTGTQRPFGVRDELAEAFHLSPDAVRVLVPDTGSGYGGKHTGECAIEAARLAKAAGRPVKLVWTREEEFTWAYFRPAGVIEVKAGVRRDGKLTAWAFHNYNSGGSAIEGKYAVANRHIEFHPSDSPLRQGSYRALAATANHFARESHMDELAHVLGMDPLVFRLKNSGDPRLDGVLEAAAERFGWARLKPAENRGFGIAGGFEKNAYVATCAEISVHRASGHVRIERLVTSFDCGAVVNPDALTNQIEGSVIMGIGGAMFEAVDFADGRIGNGRFSAYRVPRFSDAPVLETVLVDRKDVPSAGAGETPIVCVAPAIGNAIFAATGIRLRSLPMVPKALEI
ncbi:MAG TPA: molybdopterin cofactor-binding domain-containing protein [Vicinamibacteria bacterium]|nr:molybdopterin cofactor-binding domain-containing protein [Vicinamibacteria bacterium]